MSHTATIAPLVGGLGLFLIGMALMSEGLKLAAGASLKHLLTRATRTRWHGLASGGLVTALVQSSSAVTVATIGFVNAGLLPLAGALWVLFGSNVGTTMTSWIVALIGLRFNIDAFALPLVGVGALLRLTGEGTRRGHFGTALAGFGLLFVGIAMLQSAFTGVADQVDLPQGSAPVAVLAQVATGVAMTVAMQSSSASMAVALTAAQTGVLSLESAAAVVIGANIGTTVTAVIAGLGATANAKRVALAHVLFNALTAAIALLMLPWLIMLLREGAETLGLGSETATLLALFHTAFNVLGVLLMWPLGDRLAAWLATRFVDDATNAIRPVHLDDNVRSVPALALSALAAEITRLHEFVRDPLLGVALADEPARDLGRLRTLESLAAEIDRFAESVHRTAMTRENATRLAELLRAERHIESAIEALTQLPPRPAPLSPVAGSMPGALAPVGETERHFIEALASVTASPHTGAGALDAPYKACKAALLEAGALGALPISEMDPALIRASLLRRAAKEWLKAWAILLEPTAISSVG